MEKPVLPKRFYKEVSLDRQSDDCWSVLLDGRQAKTTARHVLATPSQTLADAVRAEWEAQGDEIDPATMPLTQRLMLVIDRGTEDREKWLEQVLAFLQSDLLCYRADMPEDLVQRQEDAWDPYLAWLAEAHGIDLSVTSGVMAVSQSDKSLAVANILLEKTTADELCCLVAATEITGSAGLALALWQGFRPVDDIFLASRVDETFQAEKWGIDSEAAEREAQLKAELEAVARYLDLTRTPSSLQN